MPVEVMVLAGVAVGAIFGFLIGYAWGEWDGRYMESRRKK